MTYQVWYRHLCQGLKTVDLVAETKDRDEAEREAYDATDDSGEGVVTLDGEIVWRCWE